MDSYPVFLQLQGRPVLLVGGGKVASAKVGGLIAAGARVTVVAPAILDALRRPGVRVEQREFQPGDLEGKWFVVAAATAQVNREVARAAEIRGVFVNAADDVESATAYLGGVFRKGGVTVAVSTDGRAPALAGLLREALQALLPDDLESWAEVARELRTHWKADGVALARRRPLLLRALNELYQEAA
ncbi:MAG TPA: bifunctional precorrin-2 dehydrogenase/sirohydrochlorin ferrochelatase [Myxococcales bacterium]|nr:bifunctional precorrin-2 dehydrogenase/sirohydrochlorin ferrochelatase [Myxococcales bacterium]